MSLIARDLKDIAVYVPENPEAAWAYMNLLDALAEEKETTTIGEDAKGLIKAHYFCFADGTMLCVRGDPTASADYEIRAYDSIE